ncbi:MAG: EF-P lysine aminoacylase EpmA [Desulfatiglandaceae bacterium]
MSPASKSSFPREEQKRLDERKDRLWLRARLIQEIRRFFIERQYLEVETPQLLQTPLPEVHIELIRAEDDYLQPSPELCMKRLQAAGYTRIFQICKCFRDGERGRLHLPEFTLLEWYRAGIDYEILMTECEQLIRQIAQRLTGGERIRTQEREIDLSDPWDRISVRECFECYAALDLETAVRKGRFDEVMVREIEPYLGTTKPTILYDYPASLASLARLKPENPEFAERFEIYIAGIEIANGFSELTDPLEQRRRFEKDQHERRALKKQTYPVAEKFLKSLEHMPEAAGIALGVDRLVMIFADRSEIDDVVCFTPEEL